MNIMLEQGRVIVGAGDGAFIAAQPVARIERSNGTLSVTANVVVGVREQWGAELRPIALRPTPPARAQWPAMLAACAIVFALDHGNVGAAIIVGIWWFGWAVNR
jgi:hypothetical protein